MRLITLILMMSNWAIAQDVLGTWKMNLERSTFVGDPHPRSVTVSFERSDGRQIFTFDKVGANGQRTIDKIRLYFDGKSRPFLGETCMGTQSSRRLDTSGIQITVNCQDGHRTIFTSRYSPQNDELILDLLDVRANGRRLERHLVMEK